MYRVYRYRLYPNTVQEISLIETLERLRELYNAALQERREAWKKQKIKISDWDQWKQLKDIKQFRPEYAKIHVHVLQDCLSRLDKAYRSFFERVEAGKKPGFPRFKSKNRYNTFTFKHAEGRKHWFTSKGKKITLSGIGNVKIKLHRPFEGTLKQVSITLDSDNNWYALLVCSNIQIKDLPKTNQDIGIDLGITHFITLSSGETIENPRFYQTNLRKLKTIQRKICRRHIKSKRRSKVVKELAKQHHRIKCKRKDFHHKTALNLIKRFDFIAIEDIAIENLAKGPLAKQIHDVSWGAFICILFNKAERAGKEILKVNPNGTSQKCSACGKKVFKSLGDRTHTCECGISLDRDHNAAINVLRLGHSLRGELAIANSMNRETSI